MSDTPKQNDWTKPAAMAIPKGGSSRTTWNRAAMARSFPRRRRAMGSRSWRRSSRPRKLFYEHARNIEKAVAGAAGLSRRAQAALSPLAALPDQGRDLLQYQGIFDTDFDKYTEDAVAIFSATGIDTVFENLEGFPKDWKTNPSAFIKFVREHHCPSFLEYGEYPYVSADEIKKALKLKAAFTDMLDQMQ